ncbi:hypothetical protein OXX80_000924 [Metschnikowia pulcherrima]
MQSQVLPPSTGVPLPLSYDRNLAMGMNSADMNSSDEKKFLGHAADPSVAASKHAVPFNGLNFHNPFDVNSYPLTNPPLYDPTMLPYGAPGSRRRRISISNGQIGQIVNHEAFYIDDDSLDEYYDGSGYKIQPPQHQDDSNVGRTMTQQAGHNGPISQPLSSLPFIQPAMASQSTIGDGSVNNLSVQGTLPANVSNAGRVNVNGASVAGVPPQNHTLVYNNEVIYNPHDGPIPGTAAWKKERLLERNRVAASKCRQRKKHAQQKLQNSIEKAEQELRAKAQKLEKAEQLLAVYNKALQRHFSGDAGALESIRAFTSQSLDEVKL